MTVTCGKKAPAQAGSTLAIYTVGLLSGAFLGRARAAALTGVKQISQASLTSQALVTAGKETNRLNKWEELAGDDQRRILGTR